MKYLKNSLSVLVNKLYLHNFDTICFRFVFMALMEYCLVNIVLGDADMPPRMSKKSFDFSFRVNIITINICLQQGYRLSFFLNVMHFFSYKFGVFFFFLFNRFQIFIFCILKANLIDNVNKRYALFPYIPISLQKSRNNMNTMKRKQKLQQEINHIIKRIQNTHSRNVKRTLQVTVFFKEY